MEPIAGRTFKVLDYNAVYFIPAVKPIAGRTEETRGSSSTS